jgi:hypothetical protein
MPRLAVTILVALLLAGPAAAQQDPVDEAGRLAGEALGKLMDAMGTLLQALPQYRAPEVLENGDIIIRRVPAEPDRDPPPEDRRPAPPPDTTETRI